MLWPLKTNDNTGILYNFLTKIGWAEIIISGS